MSRALMARPRSSARRRSFTRSRRLSPTFDQGTGFRVIVRLKRLRTLTPLPACVLEILPGGVRTRINLSLKSPTSSLRRGARRAAMLAEIKSTARGAAILADWLGAGGEPVSLAHANHRAEVCARCILNVPGSWWDSVKSVLANNIREYVAVKRSLNLVTPHDPRLGTCQACMCNNPLQVWVPIEHVRKHTPPETIEKFTSFCWKKKELQS